MTDPDPPVEIAWDPEGDQFAAIEPVTVTSDMTPRGAQNTA